MTKGKKREQPKKPADRKYETLKGPRRLVARYACEELIAMVATKADAVTALREKFGCSEATAETVYKEAWAALTVADTAQKPQRQALLVARFEALYRKSWSKGQGAVCLGILRELKSMWGVGAPIQLQISGTDDEYAGRSVEELEHFLEHGCWPEEKPKQIPKTVDPLAKLH